jgi:Tfp pilus assembly protein PilV
MTTLPRRSDGFTLIESMIAMFFLSFMVVEMAMVDVGAKRSSHLASQITKANTYADEGMEKTRNILYAKLLLPSGNMNEACATAGNVTTCTSITPLDGIYTRQRIVTPLTAANVATTLAAGVKADVVVTVTFTDARGTAQRVSLASVMSKY